MWCLYIHYTTVPIGNGDMIESDNELSLATVY